MKDRAEPRISVVIPAFNSENSLSETIRSVLEQLFPPSEIIIIDDGSTDSTHSVAQKIAEKTGIIKLLKIPHSGRPSVPRNLGIKSAAGEYIAFLDSDDKWLRNKLSDQTALIRQDPELILVYSMSRTFGDVSVCSGRFEVLPLLFRGALNCEDLILRGNTITCSSVLARKDKLIEAGLFDEDPRLKAVEDYDLWIRVSRLGKIGFIPRIHVLYRIDSCGISGSDEIRQQRLNFLAEKLGIKLPPYKFSARRGLHLLILRNFLHLLTLVFARLIQFFGWRIAWTNEGKRRY